MEEAFSKLKHSKMMKNKKLYNWWRSLAFVLAGMVLPVGAADESKEDATVVLITGANRGIGLQFAEQYAAQGFHVIGTARKPDEATELKETGAEVLKLDVTKDEDIQAMTETLKDRRIDILINNAGYKGLEKTRADLVKTFDVNAASPFLISEALIPNLKLSKSPKIINITSQQAQLEGGTAPMNGYSISKTALNMVTRSFHARFSKDGFIVVCIEPGWNRTDMGGDKAPLDPKESTAKVIKIIDSLKPEQSGRFYSYTGEERPW